MNDIVFYFAFFEEGELVEALGFIVRNRDRLLALVEARDTDDFIQSDPFEEIFDALEGEFGVHDWSTHPSPEIEAIGYTTYEVEPVAIPVLMGRWRDWFVSQGADVTPVVSVDATVLCEGDDMAVYNNIQSKL